MDEGTTEYLPQQTLDYNEKTIDIEKIQRLSRNKKDSNIPKNDI